MTALATYRPSYPQEARADVDVCGVRPGLFGRSSRLRLDSRNSQAVNSRICAMSITRRILTCSRSRTYQQGRGVVGWVRARCDGKVAALIGKPLVLVGGFSAWRSNAESPTDETHTAFMLRLS